MDEVDTILNELRRAVRYLVLVLDDAALVSIKQTTEDVVRTLDVRVSASNAHQSAFLVYLTAVDFIKEDDSSILQADALYADGLADERFEVLLDGSRNEVAKRSLHNFAPFHLCLEARLLHRNAELGIRDGAATLAVDSEHKV